MLKTKQLKRIIALGISLALLLTSLICANAEVNLTASATITDAQNNIVFEPSTVSTGSLGWVENTSDVNKLLNPEGYGLQENGLYKFMGNTRNGSWQSMFVYDETIPGLTYKKVHPPAVAYPAAYKIDTSAYSGISNITSYSGKLYSSYKFTGNLVTSPDAAIVVNYIDNGNFDYVYPYVESSRLYLRTYSVRTETVTVGDVSYKKIYGSYSANNPLYRINQHSNGDEFTVATETVDGAEFAVIEFNVTYSESGITLTFKSGECTTVRTLANDYFLSHDAKNHFDFSNNTDVKSIASFGNYPLSAAKAVGVVSNNYTSYIGDAKVTFEYNRSAADLAADFRTNHKDILAKETATEADQAAIDAALADYNSIIAVAPGAESELATEKAKLDNLQGSIMDAAVNAYFDAHSAALVITADTVNKDNVASVIAASTAYKALSDAIKTGVLAKYNADNGASITDLGATLDAIAKAVYYDKDGALIYDDFSGNNADAWEKASYDSGIKYIKTRGEKPIASVTYNLEIKVPESGKDFKNQLMYYYDNPARGAFYVGYDGSGKLFLQRGVCVSLNGNYSMMNTPIWLSEVKGRDVVHLTVKFGYDYAPFYAEASKLPYGNVEYAAKYIKVSLEATVEETQETFNPSYTSVYPNQEGPELTDVFTVGMNNIDPENELQVASIEIAYAKSADEFSAEFEAYADTYGKSASAVTKDDITAIDSAIAVYNGLNDTKKAVYVSDYEALVALKAVADLHAEIDAIVVTPASEAAIEKAVEDFEALNAANAAVSATIADKQAAFDAFRPEMYSATIKKVENEDQQDLRFKTYYTANGYTANIVSYGMVMVPNLALGNNELVIGGSYEYAGYTFNAADAALTLDEGEEMPSEFHGYLGNSGSTDNRCGTRIAARAYVIYEIEGIEYTVYSTASRNTSDEVVTQGVRNGVCVRSVYSIARAMAKDLIASGTYNTTDVITSETKVEDLANIAGADIIKFTAANVKNIENLAK